MIARSFQFWTAIRKILRAVFIACLGLFVLFLFGGAQSVTGGFMFLIFIAMPVAGAYLYAHRMCVAHTDASGAEWDNNPNVFGRSGP